jgi:ELWxxDGT repeat protein
LEVEALEQRTPLTGAPLSNLTELQGVSYFTTEDPAYGTELWRSTGAPGGTTLVSVLSHQGSYLSSGLVWANGALFFAVSDPDRGAELWKSAGTAAGTVLVKDVLPAAGNPSLMNLTSALGAVYFTANDPVHGAELWRSDGTAAGTRIVKDIVPGQASSDPQSLTVATGKLIFTISNPSNGFQLWESDGTASGTYFVHQLYVGPFFWGARGPFERGRRRCCLSGGPPGPSPKPTANCSTVAMTPPRSPGCGSATEPWTART